MHDARNYGEGGRRMDAHRAQRQGPQRQLHHGLAYARTTLQRILRTMAMRATRVDVYRVHMQKTAHAFEFGRQQVASRLGSPSGSSRVSGVREDWALCVAGRSDVA